MAEKTFSKEELATFNGQNGQPTYVAVNGTVYDVSGKKAWTDGKHHGHIAGQDLTDALLNDSPHGDKVLKRLPVVGKLI
ncbi:MAG: cytochrome B5 [Candidatus Limosilactobacillus merdavium]|uniref:Cytochrome B5 n=1 Tax=Candidatus Limosilactobacillus merdavium TaxID=2838651 RepID=A0A9E2NUT6_9LACO|nr:cytochrome B5 [Candidatus Limosilactobacillus merdavium]